MFASTVAPSPTPSGTTSSASPSRSGRLRGLSYLRTYTHNHLLSHSNLSRSEASTSRPSLSRSSSTPVPDRQESHKNPKTRPAEANVRSPHGSTGDLIPDNQSGTTAHSASTTGWLPTVGGLLSRVATIQPQSPGLSPPPAMEATSQPITTASPSPMRLRASTASHAPTPSTALRDGEVVAPHESRLSASMNTLSTEEDELMTHDPASLPATDIPNGQLPSIRFIPYHDPRSARPSLQFTAVSRTLPNSDSVIRVGRYSERDQAPEASPNAPSATPVGFKSKVVSRRHCEFSCQNSQWYVKDVKSSSGTFLNHIRLSPAGHESRLWPVNDGDVLQLGIDFRGGEEMIFRCVKIRIELNRGWQKGLNSFNKSAHKRIRNLSKNVQKKDADAASSHTSECAICLLSVSPCQSLFVAPCSHVWHYRCIRPILNGRTYPQFTCPNCRMLCDLEADVDELSDFETDDQDADLSQESQDMTSAGGQFTNGTAQPPSEDLTDANLAEHVGRLSISRRSDRESHQTADTEVEPPQWGDLSAQPHAASVGVGADFVQADNSSVEEDTEGEGEVALRTPRGSAAYPSSLGFVGPEGPMTPRNDAGPFIFDGSAGRRGDLSGDVASLDRAATLYGSES